MAEYFDAYRIDHVLGFCRICEIPINAVHALLGQFSPALGMTPAEVEAYGLQWQEDLFTTPFIADWTLERVFGDRAEAAQLDASATELLDAETDTAQLYNGRLFTLSDVRSVFPDILGFKIASRKIYYRLDGLWVANIDGSNPVQIDDEECSAMTLDTKDSRIYWANASGVWYMPFVGSDNNKFVTVPEQLNEMTDVTKIAADAVLR
jgi:hypothetical protein